MNLNASVISIILKRLMRMFFFKQILMLPEPLTMTVNTIFSQVVDGNFNIEKKILLQGMRISLSLLSRASGVIIGPCLSLYKVWPMGVPQRWLAGKDGAWGTGSHIHLEAELWFKYVAVGGG